jgi:hypothetical protein
VRIPFRDLPGRGEDVARPILDVFVEGIERTGLACLVDTGALHNRFAFWVADFAGIKVGPATETIAVGGHLTMAYTADVDLRVGEETWRAPVSFCDPWPWDFHLLGQEGFLRYFDVCLSGADLTLDVTRPGR